MALPPAGVAAPGVASPQPTIQVGLASWYGEHHQGNPTANGEPFDMNGLTAAHRTFPMGARVKVTNLVNKRSVTLRVNDRGPGIKSRVIDVSMAAAKSLGFLRAGVVPVQVEVLSLPKSANPLKPATPTLLLAHPRN
jgi:rare lipoprotein A